MTNHAIPRLIWQTCPGPLPLPAREPVGSWQRQNPEWTHHLLTDEAIDHFIEDHFDADLLAAFRDMPLGVMRADIWRYAVLRVHGGVYSDIDTTCRQPLDEWLPGDASLVVGLENGTHFCQWTMAAAAGMAVFDIALALVVERWRQGISTERSHFVHYHTGPQLWTEAMRRYLGAEPARAEQIVQRHGDNPQVCFLAESTLNDGAVYHHYASQRWGKAEHYASWITLRDQLSEIEHGRPRRGASWTLCRDDGVLQIRDHRGRYRFPCNETLAWLFAHSDGERTIAALAASLREDLADCPDDLERQLHAALCELRERGMVSF